MNGILVSQGCAAVSKMLPREELPATQTQLEMPLPPKTPLSPELLPFVEKAFVLRTLIHAKMIGAADLVHLLGAERNICSLKRAYELGNEGEKHLPDGLLLHEATSLPGKELHRQQLRVLLADDPGAARREVFAAIAELGNTVGRRLATGDRGMEYSNVHAVQLHDNGTRSFYCYNPNGYRASDKEWQTALRQLIEFSESMSPAELRAALVGRGNDQAAISEFGQVFHPKVCEYLRHRMSGRETEGKALAVSLLLNNKLITLDQLNEITASWPPEIAPAALRHLVQTHLGPAAREALGIPKDSGQELYFAHLGRNKDMTGAELATLDAARRLYDAAAWIPSGGSRAEFRLDITKFENFLGGIEVQARRPVMAQFRELVRPEGERQQQFSTPVSIRDRLLFRLASEELNDAALTALLRGYRITQSLGLSAQKDLSAPDIHRQVVFPKIIEDCLSGATPEERTAAISAASWLTRTDSPVLSTLPAQSPLVKTLGDLHTEGVSAEQMHRNVQSLGFLLNLGFNVSAEPPKSLTEEQIRKIDPAAALQEASRLSVERKREIHATSAALLGVSVETGSQSVLNDAINHCASLITKLDRDLRGIDNAIDTRTAWYEQQVQQLRIFASGAAGNARMSESEYYEARLDPIDGALSKNFGFDRILGRPEKKSLDEIARDQWQQHYQLWENSSRDLDIWSQHLQQHLRDAKAFRRSARRVASSYLTGSHDAEPALHELATELERLGTRPATPSKTAQQYRSEAGQMIAGNQEVLDEAHARLVAAEQNLRRVRKAAVVTGAMLASGGVGTVVTAKWGTAAGLFAGASAGIGTGGVVIGGSSTLVETGAKAVFLDRSPEQLGAEAKLQFRSDLIDAAKSSVAISGGAVTTVRLSRPALAGEAVSTGRLVRAAGAGGTVAGATGNIIEKTEAAFDFERTVTTLEQQGALSPMERDALLKKFRLDPWNVARDFVLDSAAGGATAAVGSTLSLGGVRNLFVSTAVFSSASALHRHLKTGEPFSFTVEDVSLALGGAAALRIAPHNRPSTAGPSKPDVAAKSPGPSRPPPSDVPSSPGSSAPAAPKGDPGPQIPGSPPQPSSTSSQASATSAAALRDSPSSGSTSPATPLQRSEPKTDSLPTASRESSASVGPGSGGPPAGSSPGPSKPAAPPLTPEQLLETAIANTKPSSRSSTRQTKPDTEWVYEPVEVKSSAGTIVQEWRLVERPRTLLDEAIANTVAAASARNRSLLDEVIANTESTATRKSAQPAALPAASPRPTHSQSADNLAVPVPEPRPPQVTPTDSEPALIIRISPPAPIPPAEPAVLPPAPVETPPLDPVAASMLLLAARQLRESGLHPRDTVNVLLFEEALASEYQEQMLPYVGAHSLQFAPADSPGVSVLRNRAVLEAILDKMSLRLPDAEYSVSEGDGVFTVRYPHRVNINGRDGGTLGTQQRSFANEEEAFTFVRTERAKALQREERFIYEQVCRNLKIVTSISARPGDAIGIHFHGRPAGSLELFSSWPRARAELDRRLQQSIDSGPAFTRITPHEGPELGLTALQFFNPRPGLLRAPDPLPAPVARVIATSERLNNRSNQTYLTTIRDGRWQRQTFEFVESYLREHPSIQTGLGIADVRALTPEQACKLSVRIVEELFEYNHDSAKAKGETREDQMSALEILREGIQHKLNPALRPGWRGNGVCRNAADTVKAVFESLKSQQYSANMLRNTYCLLEAGYGYNLSGGLFKPRAEPHAWNTFISVTPGEVRLTIVDATWTAAMRRRGDLSPIGYYDYTHIRALRDLMGQFRVIPKNTFEKEQAARNVHSYILNAFQQITKPSLGVFPEEGMPTLADAAIFTAEQSGVAPSPVLLEKILASFERFPERFEPDFAARLVGTLRPLPEPQIRAAWNRLQKCIPRDHDHIRSFISQDAEVQKFIIDLLAQDRTGFERFVESSPALRRQVRKVSPDLLPPFDPMTNPADYRELIGYIGDEISITLPRTLGLVPLRNGMTLSAAQRRKLAEAIAVELESANVQMDPAAIEKDLLRFTRDFESFR